MNFGVYLFSRSELIVVNLDFSKTSFHFGRPVLNQVEGNYVETILWSSWLRFVFIIYEKL